MANSKQSKKSNEKKIKLYFTPVDCGTFEVIWRQPQDTLHADEDFADFIGLAVDRFFERDEDECYGEGNDLVAEVEIVVKNINYGTMKKRFVKEKK